MTGNLSGNDVARPVLHDGQADAMPCQCPACRSPFAVTRGGYPETVPAVCEQQEHPAEGGGQASAPQRGRA